MRKFLFSLGLLLACVFTTRADAAVTVYFDETEYLNALAASGYQAFSENFDGSAWNSVRTPLAGNHVSAPSVTSNGITWSSYEAPGYGAANVGVTTSSLWVGYFYIFSSAYRTYNYSSYYDHVFPDALSGMSTSRLYGIGGWFRGTGGSKVQIYLDGATQPVAEVLIPDSNSYFLGVIETLGFTSFGIKEAEGILFGDRKLMFAEYFTFGTLGSTGGASKDELIVDYGSTYGLWQYDQAGGWKRWNTVNPSQMVTVDLNGDGTDELVAAFPGYGLYTYDSTNGWTRINTVVPDAMIRQGNGLACDYGALYGLWYYDSTGGWQRRNVVDPGQMVAVDIDNDGVEELVVSFSGYGLWYYHLTSGWTRINTVVPDAMIRQGNGLACDYGALYGLWYYDSTGGWQRRNVVDPGQMVAVDIDKDSVEELVVSFSGYGLWYYHLTSGWTRINTVVPDAMIRQGNGLACDYGALYGLWYYDSTGGWQRRNVVDPGQMVAVDIDKDSVEELVVSFSGYGLWYYHLTNGWQRINTVVPVDMKPLNFYP